jgi:hypothetical protein
MTLLYTPKGCHVDWNPPLSSETVKYFNNEKHEVSARALLYGSTYPTYNFGIPNNPSMKLLPTSALTVIDEKYVFKASR